MPNIVYGDVERFKKKFVQGNEDECWNWLGAKMGRGYGVLRVGDRNVGTMIGAHRLAWQLSNREIPEGKMVLHKCNNKGCVNPNHLYLGSGSDNMMDRIRDGYAHSQSLARKLFDEDVQVIRGLLKIGGLSQELIAKMFKVSQGTISDVNINPNFPTKGSVKDWRIA